MDTVYGRNQKIKGRLQNNFDLDYAFLEKALENSGDMVKNVFYAGDGKTRAVAIYVDGLTDSQTLQDFVIRPLQETVLEGRNNLLSFVENHVLETVDWKSVETYEDALTDILSGNSLLLVEGCEKAVSLSTKNFPSRGVERRSRKWSCGGRRTASQRISAPTRR